MTSPKTSRKSHRGIQSRIENTTRLIAEFRTRELTRRDVMALFDFSSGGAGKYLNDLLAHDIIEISRLIEPRAKTPGTPVYWLIANDAAIDAYMAETSGNAGGAMIPKKARADKSRQFHVMHDDAAFKLKLHRAPAAADPMALPADFFRPQSTDCAPRLAMPVIPPKPQGFPVPGQYRFEIGASA